MIGAIVLAAEEVRPDGPSEGRPATGAHGHTVLSMGVSALVAAGVPRVVVVAGAHPDAVRGALGARDRRASAIDHPPGRRGSCPRCGAGSRPSNIQASKRRW